MQVTVTVDRLEGLLGAETVRSLTASFGEHAYDTIKLWRVEAHGLCVPFHTDYSRYDGRCSICRMCILAISVWVRRACPIYLKFSNVHCPGSY